MTDSPETILKKQEDALVVRQVGERIMDYMEKIAAMFRANARITVIVRNPSLDDGDMVITDDTFDNAIAALHKRKLRDRTVGR